MTDFDRGFPNLSNLMSSYFHQDYDVHGETDDDVIFEYAKTSRLEDIKAAVRELDALLQRQTVGILHLFESQVRSPDYMIAQDDEGARDWLGHARNVLVGYIEQSRSET